MRQSRPLSYQVGPYVVREDAGAPKGADGSRIARVFSDSAVIAFGTLKQCMDFAKDRVYQDALDRREEYRDEPVHPEDRMDSEA